MLIIFKILYSSYTSLEHYKEGYRSLDIYYLTKFSKAPSGTNKEGRNPLAFLMAVLISSSDKISKGSISFKDFLNISPKIKFILDPPRS